MWIRSFDQPLWDVTEKLGRAVVSAGPRYAAGSLVIDGFLSDEINRQVSLCPS